VADWPLRYIMQNFKQSPSPEISMMQRASFPLEWTPLDTARAYTYTMFNIFNTTLIFAASTSHCTINAVQLRERQMLIQLSLPSPSDIYTSAVINNVSIH